MGMWALWAFCGPQETHEGSRLRTQGGDVEAKGRFISQQTLSFLVCLGPILYSEGRAKRLGIYQPQCFRSLFWTFRWGSFLNMQPEGQQNPQLLVV